MPIIYGLVARGTHVLAEYTLSGITGNFSTVTRVLLKKIPPQDSKMSYIYDKYTFHYVVSNELIYLCMSDRQFSRVNAFQYLEDIKQKFVAMYADRAKTAIAFAFNAEFQRVLQQNMEKYNGGIIEAGTASDAKLNKVKQEVKELHEVMVDNLEKVIDRADRIELLVTKAEELDEHSLGFRDRSTQLKRTFWWKNVRMIIIILVAVIVLILIIVASACGGLKCNK